MAPQHTSEVIYAELTKEKLAHNKAKTRIVKLEAQLLQEKSQRKTWSTQVTIQQAEIVVLRDQLSSTEKSTVKVKIFSGKRGKTPDMNTALSRKVFKLQEENSIVKVEKIEIKAKAISLEQEKEAWEDEKENLRREIEELKLKVNAEPNSPTSQLVQDMSDISLKDLEINQLKEMNQQLEE